VSLAFLAPELGKWDQLAPTVRPAVLVLPFFADERPLRGAAGLCDWRLCGRLSRMLGQGRVQGGFGEATLYPPGRRLAFPLLLLFGLGPIDQFDERRAREASRRIQEMLPRLKLPGRRYALVPPGRSTGRLSARRAIEIYLEELARGPGGLADSELTMVESVSGQKESADLARR
jgi:hypothetical protein